jgi:hypothetical protein
MRLFSSQLVLRDDLAQRSIWNLSPLPWSFGEYCRLDFVSLGHIQLSGQGWQLALLMMPI